ncbi:MAG TPA: hypothetical protein VFW53_00690 [Gallionella sp.]|nr:hypothetical protein [Gallionella sp.]
MQIAGFIKGKVEGKFVIILNVDPVLSLDEISSLAGINNSAAIVRSLFKRLKKFINGN